MKTVDLNSVKAIVDNVQSKTKKEVIKIVVKNEKPGLLSSKFGGTPYLPKGEEVPRTESGTPLVFLAQLNLEEMPKNEFLPKKGILQFFIESDELMGTDYDDLTKGNGHRVIYRKEIDKLVKEEEIKKEIDKSIEEIKEDYEDFFPVKESYKITFEETGKEGVSTLDYQFSDLVLEEYNKTFKDNKINEIWDMDEKIYYKICEEYASCGSKVLGYPYFTQEDPRGYGYRDEYDTLLLQIDSEIDGDLDICWGDCGVCNFFIKSEDLEKCNFRNILYNWDCC